MGIHGIRKTVTTALEFVVLKYDSVGIPYPLDSNTALGEFVLGEQSQGFSTGASATATSCPS